MPKARARKATPCVIHARLVCEGVDFKRSFSKLGEDAVESLDFHAKRNGVRASKAGKSRARTLFDRLRTRTCAPPPKSKYCAGDRPAVPAWARARIRP